MGAASPEPELRTNYMRPANERDLREQIAACERQLMTSDVTGRVEGRGALQRQIRRMKHDLETQALPDLEGPQLDAIAREQKELEATLRSEMLPRDVMMRNPPGAVGKNIEFEKKHKEKILKWKRNQLLLHRGSDDPDIANAERLRPEFTAHHMNMADAQIAPKIMSIPSPQYMQNYEGVAWEGQETQAQLLERLEALEAKLAQVEEAKKRPKRTLTPEQKARSLAALEKARRVKAAKKAAAERQQQEESQAQETTSGEA